VKAKLLPMIAVVTILLGFTCAPALGSTITQTLYGQVTYADPLNPFGITTDTPVVWNVTYDPGWIEEGAFTLSVDDYSGEAFLNVSIGSLFFEEFEDVEYGNGYPEVWFQDGQIVGVNFTVDFLYPEAVEMTTDLGIGAAPMPYIFSAVGNSFEIYEPQLAMVLDQIGGPTLVEGENFSSNVPLPAAFWLLGSGLLGLVGLRRRMSS